MIDRTWDEALARAVGPERGATEGTLLFLEQREDLQVELTDSEPASVQRSLVGLSARGPFGCDRIVHLSNPVPDDARRLLAAAVNVAAPWPEPQNDGKNGGGPACSLSPQEAAARLRHLVTQVSRHREDLEVSARWVGFEQRVRIARPGCPVVTDSRRSSRVRVEATMSGAATPAVAEAVLPPAGKGANETLEMLAAAVVERADKRVGACAAPAGEHTVVLAPGVSGVLIHEIAGHALEADNAMGGSWLGRAEERVAPDTLAVIDDPRRGRAAWRVDDEGEPARATPLLRDGRVAGWMHDRHSARRSGRRATGHGRRSSYREPVRPRMGCTFIAAGPLRPAEVLEGISKGVYVRRMESATVDPLSGRAVFRVTDADLICDGKLDVALDPHLLVVDARQALAGMDRIADDVAFDTCIGSCQRDGQPLAVSVGGPTIRIGLVRVQT